MSIKCFGKQANIESLFTVTNAMQSYTSKSKKPSGVTAYKAGADYISIIFANGSYYRYSYASAGQEVVEKMKELAAAQNGLSTYISQHQPAYE